MKTKQKVLAYITRTKSPGTKSLLEPFGEEVLVFLHRDHPEAGLQVPGGTVDPGEDFYEAILREIFEESGLVFDKADIAEMVGETHYQRKDIPEINHRHYFLIRTKGLAGSWAHTVHSSGADDGLVFLYSWMETTRAKQELTGQMGELLP